MGKGTSFNRISQLIDRFFLITCHSSRQNLCREQNVQIHQNNIITFIKLRVK